MDKPYLATSMVNFWGKRWNFTVQQSLYKLVFVPLVEHGTHQEIGPNGEVGKCRKPSAVQKGLASFCTFLFSSCLHEYMLLIMMNTPSHFEQSAFFAVHGVICFLEVIALKCFKEYFSYNLSRLPTLVKITYCYTVMLSTIHLFMNPWVREDLIVVVENVFFQ
jgi:hypothetical protein